MLIFKEQIHDLGHLVSGMSILLLINKIEALMKLKLPTNIKEVKHFLRLNRLLPKIHMQLHRHHPSLKLLNTQIQTFHLDPRMSIQFCFWSILPSRIIKSYTSPVYSLFIGSNSIAHMT